MSFVKRDWIDRISEYPGRRKLIDEEGNEKIYTVERYEGEILAEGDSWSADNMNDLENRIGDVIDGFAASFATQEDADTSSINYPVGAFMTHLGSLYRVVVAIKSGDTLDPMTNIKKISVGSMLEHMSANGKDFLFAYDPDTERYGYAIDGTFHPFRNPAGNATPADVRAGKTFSSADLENAIGTMKPEDEVKAEALEIRENGTYEPPNGEYYNKVIADVSGSHLIEKTITENGVYDPAKEYYDEAKKIMADGYSRVTVNVAGGGGKETREITAVALQDLKAGEDAACRMQISNYESITGASVLYAYGSHIYAWRLTNDHRSWIDQYDIYTGGLKKTVADGNRGSKDTETGNPATNAIFDGKYILICGTKSWSVIDAETGDLIVDQQAWGDITLHGNSYYGTNNLKTANPVLPKQYDRIIAGTGDNDNFLVFDITAKSVTPLALKGYTQPFTYTDNSFVALSYDDRYQAPGFCKPTGIAVFDFSGNATKRFSLSDTMIAKDGFYGVGNTYYCYNQRLYWRGRAGTDYNKSILIWDLENLSDGATLDAGNATIVDVGIDLNVTAIDSSNDRNSDGGNDFYLSQDKKKLISSCKNGTYYIDIDTNTAHTISTTNIAGAKIGFTDAFLCNGALYDYDGKTLPNIKRYVARAAQSYNQHPDSWALGFMKEDVAAGTAGKIGVIFDSIRQIYDFDFTKSLNDTISGVKAALCNGATQDGEGIHIAHAKEYAELFRIPAFPCFFEVEFGDFNAISNESDGTVFYSAGGLWHIPSLRTGKAGWWEYCDGWHGPLNVGESADVFQNASLLAAISESKELDIYVKIQDTYKLALHRQSMTAGVCDSLIQIGRNDVYGAYGMTLKSCKVWQGEFEDYNFTEKLV